MPPFSPAANGFIPNSMKLFWPSRPCQAWVGPQGWGGSMRAVEPAEPPPLGRVSRFWLVQSASEQYTAPGTLRPGGSETDSFVLAMLAAMLEHGGAGVTPGGVEQSAEPPASYTLWVPACLYRVVVVSTTSQFMNGKTSLKPAKPFRSVLLKKPKLPSR